MNNRLLSVEKFDINVLVIMFLYREQGPEMFEAYDRERGESERGSCYQR